MGLAWQAKACAVTAFAMLAVPGRADVIQIESDGARWVTGAQASTLVSPTLHATASTATLALTANTPKVPRPHPYIPAQYVEKIAELSDRYALNPALIEALVWQESRWREQAVSHKGAIGLTQLMPGTARDMGVDPHDAMANLEGGARYLRIQLDRFGGDTVKALAAYNAGPERVARANGVPAIRETRNYVTAIMHRISQTAPAFQKYLALNQIGQE